MSWSGFKKNVGRATTQVMMKTGHVEKTSDRSYEVEERRYRTLESASLRLQKEAKGYLDSLRAMTASQMRIAETIDAFYGDSGARDGVSRSYKQAVEDLDAETVKALDGPYRCVLRFLYQETEEEILRDVEAEWNFRAGNKRNYTRGIIRGRDCTGFETACELMDFAYRTTVLEPINRFCAYFPDINECIKKRSHKMLDYDSLRSKVKRLTEKPDKDPNKLPRTEKEMDMVCQLSVYPSSPSPASTLPAENGDGDLYGDLDLSIPSPPKALQRPEIERLRRERTPTKPGGGFARSPSLTGHSSSLASMGRASGAAPNDSSLQSFHSTNTPQSTSNMSFAHGLKGGDISTPSPLIHTSGRSFTTPNMVSTSSQAISKHKQPSSPFFQPSELEEALAPLKQDLLQERQADFAQAKATYLQLNEQLTQEIPQLVDLRVPYLDPTFEALVKIQLRFCAEAYSRMAQVQQYLDASTRDDYASGTLDSRVEDVLGQIRELSIAGTV